MPTDLGPPNDQNRERRVTRWTPLERSILPSLVVMAFVLVGMMVLFRMRLPPMPYSLVIILGLWVVCFVAVFLWQARRLRGRL